MSARPYDGLGPEVVLDAVESVGLHVDGRLLALNSYENRVYQIGLDAGAPVVAKFYRPDRWSDVAILEEHRFTQALADAEIPVVAPLTLLSATLHRYLDFRFALFPSQGGREPTLESAENLAWFGRLLGRIHAVGKVAPLPHRLNLLDPERIARAVAELFDGPFIPFELKGRYHHVASLLLDHIGRAFASCKASDVIAIHGDCHRGNVLWTDDGPHFVDLDDCCNGPAVHDFWMLLDGERETRESQLIALIEGYEQFMEFDRRQLHLVEALRAMRMIEYAAWVARRWEDPAFPRNFPWFDQALHWEGHIADLAGQVEVLNEPPLTIGSS